MVFVDRCDGGRRLAARLRHLRGDPDLVVVGLPRGGVPVAAEVAAVLRAPLDVIVVRKLGVPTRPEFGMGAIGENGVRVINDEVVRAAHVTPAQLAQTERRERVELERRARQFRVGRPRISLVDKVVVVVDDGVATGSTARAACDVARAEGAARIVLAVPVAPIGWTTRLDDVADELIAVETPVDFAAVGQFYGDFGQTSDSEVVALLGAAGADEGGGAGTATHDEPSSLDSDVEIRIDPVVLTGHLTVPSGATGFVIFAHGSGSSRHSHRNQQVAAVLNEAGLATLLFDLLTGEEERDRANVFDIDLLAGRLVDVTDWAHDRHDLRALPIGSFGASTGAAAALWAAARPTCRVGAVVSRGGRPDLASPRLGSVRAPTLLIVGGNDTDVLRLNREALDRMTCEKQLSVVPGASHLFEEPGTLQSAAELARGWFLRHLRTARVGGIDD